MTFAAWEGATECTGAAMPGARALMAGCLEAYGDQGASSLGIYNCRDVRGSSTRSCHAEGRACDVGFPLVDGGAHPAGQAMLDSLRGDAEGLGIQAMIYDRTIYSRRSPAGRPYTGASPHLDHVHIELTRRGGRDLTLATVRVALGSAASEPDDPSGGGVTGDASDRPLLRRGSRGSDVALLQQALGIDADGIFGPATEAAVRELQAEAGLAVDGVVGPRTWSQLLAVRQD